MEISKDTNTIEDLEDSNKKRGITRRGFLQAAMTAAFSASAASVIGCKEKSKSSEKTKPATIERIERGVLPITKEFKDEVPLRKPKEIEVENAEYLQACKKLALKAKTLTELNLDIAIKRKKLDQNQVITELVNELATEAEKMPEFKKYIQTNKTKDFVQLSRILQPLIMDGGYYFSANADGVYDEKTRIIKQQNNVMIARIENRKMFALGDGKEFKKIPVFILDDPMATTLPDERQSVGSYDLYTNVALAFKNRAKGNLKEKLEQLDFYNLIPKNTDKKQLLDEYVNDTLIHEATHGFLAKRFPKYAKPKADIRLRFPLGYELAPGKNAMLGLDHHPMQFHEMCAVGNELYNVGSSKLPLSFYIYLSAGTKFDPMSGYAIVNRILPLLVLKYSKDTNEKRSVEQGLIQHGTSDTLSFIHLAESLSKKDIMRIGRELYTIGFRLLDTAEKGKMQEFKIPTVKK